MVYLLNEVTIGLLLYCGTISQAAQAHRVFPDDIKKMTPKLMVKELAAMENVLLTQRPKSGAQMIAKDMFVVFVDS